MNRYDCEATRDALPALIRGEMLPHEAASAEQHLERCVECAAEARIVRLLQESLAPVPAGLESRVLHAVRRHSGRRWTPARLAMAATVAAALVGGSYIADRTLRSGDPQHNIDAMSWAAVEDPLLHGGSALHDLSVEELEAVLAELDQ